MFGDRPTAASSAQDVAGKSWEIDTPSYHNIPVDKTTIFVYLGKFFISPDQHFAEGTKHHVLLPPPTVSTVENGDDQARVSPASQKH